MGGSSDLGVVERKASEKKLKSSSFGPYTLLHGLFTGSIQVLYRVIAFLARFWRDFLEGKGFKAPSVRFWS